MRTIRIVLDLHGVNVDSKRVVVFEYVLQSAITWFYKGQKLILLQSETSCYYKVLQLYYYKVRQLLLQSAMIITNCDRTHLFVI